MRRGNKWTPEEIALLFKHYEVFGPSALETLFRQHGYNRPARMIGQAGRGKGLCFKGENRGQFKKGIVPFYKGKKVPEEIRQRNAHTCFKKGNKPVNTTYVGDVRKRVRKNRIKSDGTYQRYLVIKIAEPNNWEFLHRHIWMQHHGTIPKGMLIVFRDDNPDNCVIENLEMITRKENAIRNQNYEKVSKRWENPTDKQVLGRIKMKDPILAEEVKKKPALVELVRQQIILKRTIKKIKDEKKSIVT